MNLNLRQFKALVTIAKLGSFTKAAEQLHLSQPALTVQIHDLETALGGRVLDRNTRSLRLTPLGNDLIPLLEGVLRGIDSVLASSRGLASKTSGTLSIAATPSAFSTILAATIPGFRRQYPDISIRVRDAVAHRVVSMVKAEEVDFGIGCLDKAGPDIQITPLFADRLRVLFATSHPLAQKKSIALIDLVGFPLIMLDAESGVRSLIDRGFESIGHPVVPAYEVSFISTAIGMVKAGLGISILSAAAMKTGRLSGVKSLPIRHGGFNREVRIIQKSRRPLSPAAASFIKALTTAAKTVRH